jgi:hypothetical protein
MAVCAACSGGSHLLAAPTTTNTPRSSTTSTFPLGATLTCPRRLPDLVANPGVVNLSEKLVPLTATRLDVCRYGPLVADTPLTVKSHFTVVDRATVADFEAAANLLAVLAPGPAHNCPDDNGEALVAIFSDPRHEVTVRASLSGCSLVTNGVRTALPSAQWLDRVARVEVAGCPSTPPVFAQPVLPNDPRGRTLVPITATSVRICRYAPLDDPHPNTLNGFGVLDDETSVRSLEAEANRLVRLSSSERVPCPLSTSAPSWFVTFSDATTSVDLSETAGDCGNLYNGVLTAVPTAAWRNAISRIAVLH